MVNRLSDGKFVDDLTLQAAATSLTKATGWIGSDRWLTDLALLKINQAQRLYQADPVRTELLDAAARDLRSALSVNRANATAWLRLAYVLELRSAPRREVATCLVTMLDVSPYDRGLWLWRSSQLLNYWNELSADERGAFQSNIRTMWVADPELAGELVQYASAVGSLDIVADALGDDPQAKAFIEKLTR